MGKTRPTYRDAVREERGNWSNGERMIRRQHQAGWDDIWTHADDFADVMGAANPEDTMRGILLSMCLGQQLEIIELQQRLDELEDK